MLDERLKRLWVETALQEEFHMYEPTFGVYQVRINGDTPSFMGVPVAVSAEELKGSDVAFIGIPWEGPVGTGTGTWASFGPRGEYSDKVEARSGAYDSPNYIRRYSVQYSIHGTGGCYPEVRPDFRLVDYIQIVDYRNVETKEWDVEETAKKTVEKVSDIVKAGAIPLVFGGDHSIPYPVLKGISDNTDGNIGLIWFDRHYDIGYGGPAPRPFDEFTRLNAENALYKILDNCKVDPKNVVIIGIGGGDFNTPLMNKVIQEAGITIFTVNEVVKMGIEKVIKKAIEISRRDTERIYVTLDVDVMDPISFPAQKWPEPFGLHVHDIRKALSIIVMETNLAGFDMCCVGPHYDNQGIGGQTAARLYIEILIGLALKKERGS
jgi:agmatinase